MQGLSGCIQAARKARKGERVAELYRFNTAAALTPKHARLVGQVTRRVGRRLFDARSDPARSWSLGNPLGVSNDDLHNCATIDEEEIVESDQSVVSIQKMHCADTDVMRSIKTQSGRDTSVTHTHLGTPTQQVHTRVTLDTHKKNS